MERAPKPRRHHHVSRQAIAEAGLALVDAGGPQALKFREVAAALGVGTMTLYTYVENRDVMVSDIVGLLLAEVDASPIPGETWDQSIKRVARSLRAMACRHPRAFPLVALAPIDESPILDYAQAIFELHARQGIPRAQFVPAWGLVDSFLTGFLLMEVQALTRAHPRHASEGAANGLAAYMPSALSTQAFEESLEAIVAGLRQTIMRDV